MEDKTLFFSAFLKNPREIGSIIPSSKFLINRIIRSIDFKSSYYIAEYGPGTGCITKEILKRARKDAKIFCFETNPLLCHYLKKNIKDKRLIVINDDAQKIMKYKKIYHVPEFDYVIAVLSFSTLGKSKKYGIMNETKKVLGNGGKFVFCRYIPYFEKGLQSYFSRSYVKFIPFNIPPSLVYICEK